MQFIIRKKMALRQRINKLRSFLPMQHIPPQHLILRFEGPADTSNERRLEVDSFERIIVDFIANCGINPIQVVALGECSKPSVARILKFAHRLNCPTKLTLDGVGLTEACCKELLYSGVAEIAMIFGGISAKEHKINTGLDIEVSTEGLMMLLNNRSGLATNITIEIHHKSGSNTEIQAIRDWALEIGVDHVVSATEEPYLNSSKAPSSWLHQAVYRFSEAIGNSSLGWSERWRAMDSFDGTKLEISQAGYASCSSTRPPIPMKNQSVIEVWDQLRKY